ncbi:transcription-repair coupling factor [Chlamydia trachomatis]|nr:transcription-repair coupling factor [Chlamydia trachomatis]
MDFDPTSIDFSSFPLLKDTKLPSLVENLHSGARSFVIAKLFKELKRSIVVITTPAKLDDLFEDLTTLLAESPLEFPASEIDLSPKLVNVDAVGKRDHILYSLQKQSAPVICVTTLKALLERTPSPESMIRDHLELRVGEELDPDTLLDLCKSLGYRHEALAREKGDFAFRGGIVDIFPLSSPEPFRIEFWGDRVSSIRSYNPSDQLSTGKLSQITISPATAIIPTDKLSYSLLDYFKAFPLCIFDGLSSLEDNFSDIAGILASLPKRFMPIQDLCQRILKEFTPLFFEEKTFPNLISHKDTGFSIEAFHKKISVQRVSLPFIYPPALIETSGEQNPLLAFLKTFQDFCAGRTLSLALYCSNTKSLKEAHDLAAACIPNTQIYDHPTTLSSSFALVEAGFAAVSLSEFAASKVLRRQKQRNYFSTTTEEVYIPVPGETVVHLHNGIGKFIGIEKKPNHLNIETDYLVLEYADKARLYVPSDQAYLISRYVGASEKAPDLHHLNGAKWRRSRELSENSVILYAEKLIQMEAQRSTANSFIYPPHGEEVIVS